MILILSQEGLEPTTDEVVDWIGHLGGDCVRVNGADLAGALPLEMAVDATGARLRLRVGDRDVTADDVRVVWSWRWLSRRGAIVPAAPGAEALATQMSAHLAGESNATTRAFFALFRHAHWLSRPEDATLGKLEALRAAARAGLEVPATLVTNRRSEVEAFRAAHGRIITKSIGDIASFEVAGRTFALYTAEATAEETARLPETVFPSLVQARVEKAFEVRAYWLDGRAYAMAVFSQADAQTAEDLRQYNMARPNRAVPYRLPAEVEEAIGRMMEALRLGSGSVDLIRTPDGRHVFLEVNPGGQFGMVSTACNYHLPRVVAEYLIAKGADVRA